MTNAEPYDDENQKVNRTTGSKRLVEHDDADGPASEDSDQVNSGNCGDSYYVGQFIDGMIYCEFQYFNIFLHHKEATNCNMRLLPNL
jgi:hypothetical protein